MHGARIRQKTCKIKNVDPDGSKNINTKILKYRALKKQMKRAILLITTLTRFRIPGTSSFVNVPPHGTQKGKNKPGVVHALR
jgi:hypothetical protein